MDLFAFDNIMKNTGSKEIVINRISSGGRKDFKKNTQMPYIQQINFKLYKYILS